MGGNAGGGGNGGRSGGGGSSVLNVAEEFAKAGLPSTVMKTTGSVDLNKPVKISLSGDTYGSRDAIKPAGFKFNGNDKTWEKTVEPKGSIDKVYNPIYDAGSLRGGYRKMEARVSN